MRPLALDRSITGSFSAGDGPGARYSLRRRRRSAWPTSQRVGLPTLKGVDRQVNRAVRRCRGRRFVTPWSVGGKAAGRLDTSTAPPTGPAALENCLRANFCGRILAFRACQKSTQQTKMVGRQIAVVSRRPGPVRPRLRHRRTATTDFVVTRPNSPPKPHVTPKCHLRLY